MIIWFYSFTHLSSHLSIQLTNHPPTCPCPCVIYAAVDIFPSGGGFLMLYRVAHVSGFHPYMGCSLLLYRVAHVCGFHPYMGCFLMLYRVALVSGFHPYMALSAGYTHQDFEPRMNPKVEMHPKCFDGFHKAKNVDDKYEDRKTPDFVSCEERYARKMARNEAATKPQE